MLLQKQGFSFLELILVLALLAVLSATAIPKLLWQQEVALVESSAMKLLSYFELGASQSIKRRQKLHVHYIPKTTVNDGCIVFNETEISQASSCIDAKFGVFSLKQDEQLNVQQPIKNKPTKLFSFSPTTGLPSNDLSLLLATRLNEGVESGILIRRYKGLIGCSQTGILDWQSCN